MRLLVIFVALVTFLFGMDKSAAVSAIKANPALLNTPKAQQMMKDRGVTKEEVLKRVHDLNTTYDANSTNLKEISMSNKIEAVVKKHKATFMDTNKSNITTLTTPLQYIDSSKIIKKIQSHQQRTKRKPLKRYGEKFFYNKNTLNSQILSVPDYYQLNVHDTITIQIFGGNNKVLTLSIDNNGNINLPILGPLHVSNLTLQEVKVLIKKKLQPTYPNALIITNVKINSFIQVTVSGYANAPGIYNLQSLSTVKNLLIAANGFGAIGSMRNVYLKRGGRTLKIIDFYKLIKNGSVVDTTLLRNGDIIYVPKAKNLVKLYGDVYTPAIYELKSGETLKDILSYSGGLKPDASSKQIKLKRYEDNDFTKIYLLHVNSKMALKDGDEVNVYKISQLNKDYVYVSGNIEKPGNTQIPSSKLLKDLLPKLNYLKDTSYTYGLIERFDGTIVSFNLKKPKDIKLQKKDMIYIFNKYEIAPQKFILVSGTAVKKPGKYKYLGGMRLKDIVNTAGFKQVFDTHRVQIISYDKNLRPHLEFVDYDKNPNFLLKPYDEVTFFDYYNFNPLKPITVLGQVNNPNAYLYSKDMTLKDALTLAGWFTDKADKGYIGLIRYKIVNGERTRKIIKLNTKELDFKLMPYDEISVKKVPNWGDRKTVTLKGEVKYPGIYTIKTGDTLYDVIKRAGGFKEGAYIYASVFARESVKKQKETMLNNMLYKLKKKVTIISASARGAGEQSLDANNIISAIDSLIKNAKTLKPIGRIAIKLNKNLKEFKNSNYNITLKDGDKLYIPAKTNSVIVSGEVLTETTFVYDGGDASTYIEKAGGLTQNAEDTYFVVHANGFTQKGSFGSWVFGSAVEIKPGDVITVPLKIKTSTWYGVAKAISTITYQLAVTAASLRTVGAI